MSRERELMHKLDFLCLELDIACENDYEFMQKHIKRQMAWLARELVEARDTSDCTPVESKIEAHRQRDY
jgi:hypothetical protein